MMRPLRALAAILVLAGAALTVYGVATGEMQVALVIFVPVILGSSVLGVLAIGLMIAGIFVGMADLFLNAGQDEAQGSLTSEERPSETTKRTEFGGVVLIGPIPIMFGSSKKMTVFAVIVAVVILVIVVLSLFYGGG